MMMSHHPHRMLSPGNTRKRKHSEAEVKQDKSKAEPEPKPSNRLLAGYLAHEFLTKGTLLGEKFEPDSARAGSEQSKRSQPNSQAAASAMEHESYGEVASIMKTDGTHIKGIVNPTQLSQWIHR